MGSSRAMSAPLKTIEFIDFPSWYPLVNVYITVENHHLLWVNQLFLWQFSIAFCMFTRPGNPHIYIYVYIYIIYIYINPIETRMFNCHV